MSELGERAAKVRAGLAADASADELIAALREAGLIVAPAERLGEWQAGLMSWLDGLDSVEVAWPMPWGASRTYPAVSAPLVQAGLAIFLSRLRASLDGSLVATPAD